MGKLERKYLAHYIDANMGEIETNYVRLGKDLEEYAEELNPQVNVTRTLTGAPVVSFGGYQVESSVDVYYALLGDPLFEVLSNIANNRLNDDSCLTTKVDVLVDADGNQIWAYREECWIVPVSVGGDTSGVQIPFNVHCAGNRTYGEFDITTKEFTAEDGSPAVGPVSELRVYENGTYIAPSKHAYNPVVVAVQPSSTERDVGLVSRTISVYYNSQLSWVGSYAFAGCSQLTEVSLPACEIISDYAFAHCQSLTAATFPLCTTIGGSAFYQCWSLGAADFSVCTSIGTSAFQGCTGLSSISFPSCETIGSYAFQAGSSLQTAYFPECKTIGSSAFGGHRELTTASFPKCQTIWTSAFSNCFKLTTASFPECTYVGASAFINCSMLSSVDFPKCSYIGWSAFQGCSRMTSAYFTSTNVSVGAYAFYSCYSLSDVSVPYMTSVQSHAFRFCSSLQAISLPNVASISSGAFGYCQNLVSIYLMRSAVVVLGQSAANVFTNTPVFVSTSSGAYCSIFVPASLVDAYKSATNWTAISDRITAYTG